MEETKDERTKRLARERMARFREKHPGYDTDKSRARRAKPENANYVWPVKEANSDRVYWLKVKTPCADCKACFPAECMDFDHVRGEKVNNVGTMVAHGWSWDKIEAEIAKCDLVCANCHRTRTKNRRKPRGKARDSTES